MKMFKQLSANIFVLMATLTFVGCGTTVHTMSHDEAVEARAATSTESQPIYESPTYNIPIAQAWPIVCETLSTFCDGKIKKIDEPNYHLEAKNQNVWEGDTYLVVDLQQDKQQTIVKVSVRDYGWNRNIVTRSPHILSLFLSHLDTAMKKQLPPTSDVAARLQTLDDLKAKKLITDQEYQQKRAAILNGF
jgi:hypothetical protein